jgi:TctA family transporter
MDAFVEGLRLVLAWPAFGLMLLGIVIGLYLGAVPGLGGMVGFALLMPFTFGLDPVAAFALLLGMYAVTTTSDTLTAVLLGVPGTGAAAATVLDGYPMTQRGEAMRALGASYTSSAIGGVLGALSLALSIPIIKPLILAFGPPEFFMLGVLGLTYVGALSGRSILKGMLAALLGLMISTVGYSTQGGIARYSFEINYLLDGVELIPMALGLFAIPELVELACRGMPIARYAEAADTRGQMLQGIKDAFVHRWLLFRASLIGIYIGILPGVGAAIADWVAYGHAVHSAKDKSQFGKGDVRGVIAPEAANNAVKGGDLVPTVAFGVPGSAAMSILLGAFLIHGLRPGPEMLTTKLSFTFSLVWTLVLANVIGALILMLWSKQAAKIAFVRANLIVPAIIVFAFMGAWMSKQQMGDWATLIVFGALGVVLRRAGWPRPPVILGFVLGPIMEQNLDISLQALGWTWMTRPLVLAMVALLVVSIGLEIRRRRPREATPQIEGAPVFGAPAEPPSSLPASLGLDALLLGLFAAALALAWGWSNDAAMFPVAIAVTGLAIVAVVLFADLRRFSAGAQPFDDAVTWSKIAALFAFLLGLCGLTVLLGQLVALPAIVAAYLLWWGKEGIGIALAYAAVSWVVLYVTFDRLLNTIWQAPVFEFW